MPQSWFLIRGVTHKRVCVIVLCVTPINPPTLTHAETGPVPHVATCLIGSPCAEFCFCASAICCACFPVVKSSFAGATTPMTNLCFVGCQDNYLSVFSTAYRKYQYIFKQ